MEPNQILLMVTYEKYPKCKQTKREAKQKCNKIANTLIACVLGKEERNFCHTRNAE